MGKIKSGEKTVAFRGLCVALMALVCLLRYMLTFWLVDYKSLAHSMMPQ